MAVSLPSRAVARRPRPARSRAPMRQRGPVSNRTSEAFAVGSSITRNVATMSATSGSAKSPPSPTTSTGRHTSSRAACRAGMSDRARTSTAHSPGGVPASTMSRSRPASHPTSASHEGCKATSVCPLSATAGGACNSTMRCRSRSAPATALARRSNRPPLRWFTDSSNTLAERPSRRRKCSGKSSMLATDAPRHP